MTTSFVRPMLIGDLANMALIAPVNRATPRHMQALAEANETLFTNGLEHFNRHLEMTRTEAPMRNPFQEIEHEVHQQWYRVKTEENRQGIRTRADFLTGVPLKVGIWMNEDGRFTDLRFGHWGIRSLHIGSSIAMQAHAVALLMPHDEGYLPMEAYRLDIGERTLRSLQAWFGRYDEAHQWYRNLDRHFGVVPFVEQFVDRHGQIYGDVARSNTAHFTALRAPLLSLPAEANRVIPGNDEDHVAADPEKDGTYKIFQTRREDVDKANRKYLTTPIKLTAKQLEDSRFLTPPEKNDRLFRAGLHMYLHAMRKKGIDLIGTPEALAPLMEEVEAKWVDADPKTLADLKKLVAFKAGAPFKASMWFDTTGGLSNIRLGQWGGFMMHLGAAQFGTADAVAHLIEHEGNFIPLGGIVMANYANLPMDLWLNEYREPQFYYDSLAARFGLRDYFMKWRQEHQTAAKMYAKARVGHEAETEAPLLASPQGVYTAFCNNAAGYKTILRLENGVWKLGVPEGQEIRINDEPFGPGVHEAPPGAIFAAGGQKYRLGYDRYDWVSNDYVELSR